MVVVWEDRDRGQWRCSKDRGVEGDVDPLIYNDDDVDDDGFTYQETRWTLVVIGG